MIRYEHRDTPPAGPDGMAHRAADPHAGRAGHAGAVGPNYLAVCSRAVQYGGRRRPRCQSDPDRPMAPAVCDEAVPRLGGCVPIPIADAQVEAVITKTLEETPPDATHWSTRSMARTLGLSQTAVSRIWRAFGLPPHRTASFKRSTDPFFVDKVRGALSGSPRARGGPLRRSEDANPGPEPDTADLPAAPRLSRTAEPR